jgi:hypothetical protein
MVDLGEKSISVCLYAYGLKKNTLLSNHFRDLIGKTQLDSKFV